MMSLQAGNIWTGRPKGTSGIKHAIDSSAGIKGWLDYDPDLPMKVGKGDFSPTPCSLWAEKVISAIAGRSEWERIFLTADSGASETVATPDVARNLPLLHTSRVGTG